MHFLDIEQTKLPCHVVGQKVLFHHGSSRKVVIHHKTSKDTIKVNMTKFYYRVFPNNIKISITCLESEMCENISIEI